MPCDIRIITKIVIKSEIDDIDRLVDTLKDLGIKFERGDSVSYFVDGRTKRDAVLVVRPGSYRIGGERFSLTSDMAFGPNRASGTLDIITEVNALPEKMLNLILQAYAKKTIEDELGDWGGFLVSEEKNQDGSVSLELGGEDGKTTYVTLKDGQIDTVTYGGNPLECSGVASALKAAVAGIAPHSHGPGGRHIHIGGEDHTH